VDSIDVTLLALPTPNLGADTSLCLGDSLVLDPGVPGPTFAWSTANTSPTITVNSSSNYSVTVTDGNSCSAADTINVTFIPPPAVNLGGNQTICPGDSITLNAGSAGTYLWSTGATTASIDISLPGSYAVTVTAGSCTGADSMVLSNFTPPAVNLGPDTSACQGDSIVLSSNIAGIGYLWSTSETTPSITVSAAGTYSLTVTDANNCEGVDSIDVTLLALPTPNLGADTSLCLGDSLVLDPGVPGPTFAWSTANTSPTITVNSSSNYSVTVTDGNSCSAADTINVTFIPPPAVNLGGNQTICPGDSITLNAGSAGTYLWSTGATTASIDISLPGSYAVTVTAGSCTGADSMVLSNFTPPAVNLGPDTSACQGDSIQLGFPSGSGSYLWSTGDTTAFIWASVSATYSLVLTDSNNCSDSDSVDLTFFTLPQPDLGPDTSFCPGDSVQLNAGITGVSYLWSNSSTAASIFANLPGPYSVAATDTNGCVGRDTVLVSEQTPPTVNLGGPASFCSGDSVQLDAGNPGGNYLWSTGATSQSIVVNAAGTFAVTVTDALGCEGSDSALVNVNPLPLVDISANPDSICASEGPFALFAIPSGGIFSGNGILNDSLFPDLAGTGPQTINYAFTDTNGCSNSASTVIEIIPLPNVSLSGLAPNYCVADSDVVLNFSPAGGILTGPGATTTGFSPALAGPGGPFVLTYLYTDSLGCASLVSDSTTVDDLPTAADAGPDQSINSTSTTLQGNAPSMGTGTWQSVSGSPTFSNANAANSNVSDLLPGANELTWTISFGSCPASVDTVIIFLEDLLVPTGFSPNDDGVNDQYVVRGIERYNRRVLQVFNRWGNLVYSSDNYNNDWDGTDGNGRPLADDTYFIVLELGPEIKISQAVSLKR
jgi:gliding motility-associated-like protein